MDLISFLFELIIACVAGVFFSKSLWGKWNWVWKITSRGWGKDSFPPQPRPPLLFFLIVLTPSPLHPMFCSPQVSLLGHSLAKSSCLENGKKTSGLQARLIRKAFHIASYSFSKCKTLLWMSLNSVHYLEGRGLTSLHFISFTSRWYSKTKYKRKGEARKRNKLLFW